MRALAWMAMAMATALAAGGCNGGTSDACKGVSGTCVSLTVQSSTVATVDSLHIVASGALTGDQTSSGGRANLPIVVALKLPANAEGSLDLHVEGALAGLIVGTCDTDTLVIPGQHGSAICTLMGVDNGGVDMSMGGGGDDLSGGGGGADMVTVQCDPKGVTGPKCQWRWQTPLPQGDDIRRSSRSPTATPSRSPRARSSHRDATAWTHRDHAARFPPSSAARPSFQTAATAWICIVGRHQPDGCRWSSIPPIAASPGRKRRCRPARPVTSPAARRRHATRRCPQASGNIYVRDVTGTWADARRSPAARPISRRRWTSPPRSSSVESAAPRRRSPTRSTAAATWTAVTVASITPSTTPLLTGVCLGAGATKSWWAVRQQRHPARDAATAGDLDAAGIERHRRQPLQGCVATDATHAWAFGTNGAVFVTTDGDELGGRRDAARRRPRRSMSGAHSSGCGADAGRHARRPLPLDQRRQRASPPSRLARRIVAHADLRAVAPGIVFAAGSSGAIYTTTNDGATLDEARRARGDADTASILNGVWAASATDVYAVGVGGTIVHSTNGTTFTKYAGANAPPATTTFQDVWGSPTLGVFAVGYDGSVATRVVYRTTDHGATWAQVTVAGLTGGRTGNELFTAFALGARRLGRPATAATSTTRPTAPPSPSRRPVPADRHHAHPRRHAVTSSRSSATIRACTSAPLDNGVTLDAADGDAGNDSPQNVAFVARRERHLRLRLVRRAARLVDKDATWNLVPTAMNPNLVRSAFAFAANDVFVVGDTGIIHYGN